MGPKHNRASHTLLPFLPPQSPRVSPSPHVLPHLPGPGHTRVLAPKQEENDGAVRDVRRTHHLLGSWWPARLSRAHVGHLPLTFCWRIKRARPAEAIEILGRSDKSMPNSPKAKAMATEEPLAFTQTQVAMTLLISLTCFLFSYLFPG